MENQAMAMMNCQVSDNFNITTLKYCGQFPATHNFTCWEYWQNYYYPQVIYREYPIYIRERAQDKAKQAYEIIKILKDKKLAKIEKVSDFIDLMDELIKIL